MSILLLSQMLEPIPSLMLILQHMKPLDQKPPRSRRTHKLLFCKPSRLTSKQLTLTFHSESASLKPRKTIMQEKLAKRLLKQSRTTPANFSLRLKPAQMRSWLNKMHTTLLLSSSMMSNSKITWLVSVWVVMMNWFLLLTDWSLCRSSIFLNKRVERTT